jgi:hypothetical protein
MLRYLPSGTDRGKAHSTPLRIGFLPVEFLLDFRSLLQHYCRVV